MCGGARSLRAGCRRLATATQSATHAVRSGDPAIQIIGSLPSISPPGRFGNLNVHNVGAHAAGCCSYACEAQEPWYRRFCGLRRIIRAVFSAVRASLDVLRLRGAARGRGVPANDLDVLVLQDKAATLHRQVAGPRPEPKDLDPVLCAYRRCAGAASPGPGTGRAVRTLQATFRRRRWCSRTCSARLGSRPSARRSCRLPGERRRLTPVRAGRG